MTDGTGAPNASPSGQGGSGRELQQGYNQGSNPNQGNRKNRGGGGGNNGGNNTNNGHIDPKFRNDDRSLGTMYGRYFDCSTIRDQTRFTKTKEALVQYVGSTYEEGGSQLKTMIKDLQPISFT